MKCAKAKKYISEYVDGDLDKQKSASLEKHLDACPDCRKLLEDFQRIVRKAGRLNKSEPPDRIWHRIQTRLKEERRAPVPAPRVRFLFFPARLRYGVSAALLMGVVVGAVVIGLRIWNRGKATPRNSSQEYALAKIQEAEQHYKLAIKALWEAVQAQEDNLDPQIAETFRINLELIDASLADCKRAIQSNPGDLESHYYLLAVYKKKAELLDSMMDVSSPPPPKRESKTIT